MLVDGVRIKVGQALIILHLPLLSQQWHHVTAVLDADLQSLLMHIWMEYMFGTGFGGTLNNHELVTFGAASSTGGTQYHDGDVQPSSFQDFFYGNIDEFRAYNRSLPFQKFRIICTVN